MSPSSDGTGPGGTLPGTSAVEPGAPAVQPAAPAVRTVAAALGAGQRQRPTRRSSSGPRFQRLAELVAGDLRDRILRGELADGDLLPKEADLRDAYPVSQPSLREAMRILEAEGLVTVRRGNVGGAVVHRPSAGTVAYSLAMVLAARGADITDVAEALQGVEPACAALCAQRPDRHEAVVPPLRALQEEALARLDDLLSVTRASRRFHEVLVSLCGNEPLIVMVGALERVWSAHETGWASRTGDADAALIPLDERREALDVHAALIDRIEAGDAAGASTLAREHLQTVQRYPTPEGGAMPVEPLRLRP